MLTLSGCQARVDRWLKKLDERRLDGVLITHPRDIYYFTGLWCENAMYGHPSALFLAPGRTSWLGTWVTTGDALVGRRDHYPADVLSTANPDNFRRLAKLARDAGSTVARGIGRLGYQAEGASHHVLESFADPLGKVERVAIDNLLIDQQEQKDADEIDCVRGSLAASLAGYQRAHDVIRPGINELEVLEECHRAAILAAGKPVYYGGDFRSACRGGPARNRTVAAGEFYIVDVQVDYDGYWSDLSRAWVVGGQANDLQASVYEHVAALLKDVPTLAKVGRSTRDFWLELDARLKEHPALREIGLVHHGGHGIGLRAHEGPDINRDRDGLFRVGNVFTVEPGAYLDGMNVGVRLENNFVLTENGCELLSNFPLTWRPYHY